MVPHTAPYARSSSPTAAPPHSPTTQLPPHGPRGTARPTGTGEGAGHIRGREECTCAQCDSTHEYTLHAHMQRWGLFHSLDCCHLTACSDTQCNICTHRQQLRTCVYRVQIRQGVCCRGTQRMHKRCNTEWTTHVAFTCCVAGHRQRA